MHSQQSSTSSINSHVARTSQQRTRRRKRRTSDCFFFWSSSTYLRAPIFGNCQRLRLFPGYCNRSFRCRDSTYCYGIGEAGSLVFVVADESRRKEIFRLAASHFCRLCARFLAHRQAATNRTTRPAFLDPLALSIVFQNYGSSEIGL